MAGDATIVEGRRVAERYRLVKARSATQWDAVDETLRRNVVVHLLPANADPESKQHFTAEARTLARLNHRNVVATYDTGVDGDGTSYRVDELPGGRALDLHAIADHRRLAYALQAVRAVADAHSVGLVHGALTSADVVVDDDGRVQVAGFRLPLAGDDVDAAKEKDVAALTQVVLALAPRAASALRDVAVRWQVSVPPSSAAMLDELATIPDDGIDVDTPAPPTPATGVPAVPRRGPRWTVVAVVALVFAAVAAAIVVPGQGEDVFEGTPGPVAISARSFDPEATPPTENEADARLAVDGNPSTGWATERYRSRNFGNLKSGLGLILQSARGEVQFHQIVIESPTRGWDVEVYVASQPAANLDGWGAALASATVRGDTTTIVVNGARGGAALVWIADPGPNLQVRISEVTVQGRA